MKLPSLSRRVLPALAIAGVVVTILVILMTRPDREIVDPVRTPSSSPHAEASGGTVAGAGLIEPSSELVEVGTNIPGIVARIFVEPGARVAAGEPLFEIDPRDARAAAREAAAQVELARANLAAARTRAATARAQLSLYERIDDPRAVAARDVIAVRGSEEDAVAAAEVARADLAAAEAQLARARTTLERLTVRAPIAGEVLQVRARVGEYAATGPQPGGSSEPLMVIGDTSPLHVRVDIDENEVERVKLRESAIISPRGNGNKRVRAQFVRIEPLVVPKRSLTNSASERVDVRVLQIIYALPADARDEFFIGQQIDAYIPAVQASAPASLTENET